MKFGCRGSTDKIGVLLAQLGTPDEPTIPALRRYLSQFLRDRRVVEVNRVLWWLLLNGIILRTRPKRSAALYKRVWTEEGSPLLCTTKRQAEGVQERLSSLNLTVTYGMRYGNPSLTFALDALLEEGCRRILLVPMYPQYAAATSASTYDMVFQHLLKERWVPTLRVAEPYYRKPQFINAVAYRINETLRNLSWVPERLIVSYHGVPEKYVEKGDPYCCQCTETTAALLSGISFPSQHVVQTFQSRFGRDPWLQPYADETIERLAREGVKRLAIVCPAFTADCLETIDEMGHEALDTFRKHGGEELALVPCVNEHPLWIQGLADIIKQEISGWVEQSEHKECVIACPNKVFQKTGSLVQLRSVFSCSEKEESTEKVVRS
jgi:protoporphyrin/coproporphyrin ferrochelatase